ncbi:protein FAM177A1 [Acipenser oxyrinchus oxyrinchus]|uniref:Protein FAM177A1 n=1 Tax=Acipenser oxyrinchus oxyrinchus TaxID=40147 RepID=A0AAD8CFB9_ACIOX|nr:protein FAM177A1 [Acipenser oxyrinchus oxyrinchus]KAK1149474.1 protein FAM177A1 [Acipenser oxyrinchus oxyrinchus]
MADLSLYLTNVNVSLGQKMDGSKNVGKDFESVELGEIGKEKQQKKVPRRIIHFASGDTMEEYSTDEEQEPEKKEMLPAVDPSKLTWRPYLFFHMWRAATTTISVCDFLGEKMASLFGISTPKYQYAIDEYYRMKKEDEEEEEENRMSEEAERNFQEQQSQESPEPHTEQPEGSASFVNVTFELENDPCASPENSRVPAPIPT